MLIKNIRYPQLDTVPKKQSLITLKTLIFIVSACGIATILTGCTSQIQPREVKSELEVTRVCEDGHWYDIIEKTSKTIVLEDGRFAKCESNERTF